MVRIGRVVLFLLLLAGAGVCVWHAARPALRDYRAAQRIDDLAYAGMIAQNVELLLTDPPLDLRRALDEILTPLFDGEEALAAVRLTDARGAALSEAGRNGVRQTGLAGLPAAPAVNPPSELVFRLQQLVADQGNLSARMDDALKAGKGEGLHHDMYFAQDTLIKEATLLRGKAPRLADALPAMEEAVEALTHTDADSLYLALQASEQAEAALSLALEDRRAVVDHPGLLPEALAAACPRDLLPLRARRVTVPLFTPTGDAALIAPAGTAEIIFADRPTAPLPDITQYILATPRRWAPPAALLLAALLALMARKRKVAIEEKG